MRAGFTSLPAFAAASAAARAANPRNVAVNEPIGAARLQRVASGSFVLDSKQPGGGHRIVSSTRFRRRALVRRRRSVDRHHLVKIGAPAARGGVEERRVGNRRLRQRRKFVIRRLAAQDQVAAEIGLGVGLPEQADAVAACDERERFRRRRREGIDRRDAGRGAGRALDGDGSRHLDAPHDIAALDAEFDPRIGEAGGGEERGVQGCNRCNGCGGCNRCVGCDGCGAASHPSHPSHLLHPSHPTSYTL